MKLVAQSVVDRLRRWSSESHDQEIILTFRGFSCSYTTVLHRLNFRKFRCCVSLLGAVVSTFQRKQSRKSGVVSVDTAYLRLGARHIP